MQLAHGEVVLGRAIVEGSGVALTAFALAAFLGCSDDPSPVDAGLRDCDDGPPAGECVSDAGCATGLCRRDPAVAPVDRGPAVLSCGAAIGVLPPRASCALASECAHGLCAVSGRCVAPCDGACDANERCTPVFVRYDGAIELARACVPDLVVPASVSRSRRIVRAPSSGSIRLEGLGASGVAVLFAHCDVPALEARSLASSLVLFEAGTPGAQNPIARGTPLTVFVPNNAEAPIDPAGYLLELGAPASDVEVIELSRDRSGGSVDLEIYYVGASGLSVEGDRGPPPIAAAIAGLERRYLDAGIVVGTVRQHELVGSLRDELAIVEGDTRDEALDRIAMLSAGEDRPAIRIAFVRSMEALVGFTAAIPGPPGLPGRSGSTIVIGADLLSASSLDRAVSHEVGHLLGLFHPTELDGSTIEPIADTPVCDRSHDADGDGFLSDVECVGFGAENLMFWSAAGDSLSPDQLGVTARAIVLE